MRIFSIRSLLWGTLVLELCPHISANDTSVLRKSNTAFCGLASRFDNLVQFFVAAGSLFSENPCRGIVFASFLLVGAELSLVENAIIVSVILAPHLYSHVHSALSKVSVPDPLLIWGIVCSLLVLIPVWLQELEVKNGRVLDARLELSRWVNGGWQVRGHRHHIL